MSNRRLPAWALILALLPAALAVAAPVSPQWGQLSARQQTVLAPLWSEWDRFSPQHKQHLLNLVSYYDRLTPPEQRRVDTRLKAWADLPGDQQQLARERWQRLMRLAPAERAAALARLRAH